MLVSVIVFPGIKIDNWNIEVYHGRNYKQQPVTSSNQSLSKFTDSLNSFLYTSIV